MLQKKSKKSLGWTSWASQDSSWSQWCSRTVPNLQPTSARRSVHSCLLTHGTAKSKGCQVRKKAGHHVQKGNFCFSTGRGNTSLPFTSSGSLLPPGPGAWESAADSGKDEMARSQVRNWQFSRGFEVYSAKTGQSGLKVGEKGRPIQTGESAQVTQTLSPKWQLSHFQQRHQKVSCDPWPSVP